MSNTRSSRHRMRRVALFPGCPTPGHRWKLHFPLVTCVSLQKGFRSTENVMPRSKSTTFGESNTFGVVLSVSRVRISLTRSSCSRMRFRRGPSPSVGSEGRRGRWGTPTMALHIRIQHRKQTDNESKIRQSYTNPPQVTAEKNPTESWPLIRSWAS